MTSVMEPIFFRFTNRDRAKNYGPFPNFGFYNMIIYPLIYPQKHPEGTQPFKKKSSAKLLLSECSTGNEK